MSSYSCLLDCFAYANNIDIDVYSKYLNHDGSQILRPELPEPFCRRGFNVFELMDVSCRYFKPCTFLTRVVVNNNALSKTSITLELDLTSKYFNLPFPFIAMTSVHAVVCNKNTIVYNPGNQKICYNDLHHDHIALIVFPR